MSLASRTAKRSKVAMIAMVAICLRARGITENPRDINERLERAALFVKEKAA